MQLSRRRLLGAGIVGAGAALLAPERSLRAIASGLDRPDGLWSVAADERTGDLIGLFGSDGVAHVHRLLVDADGVVHPGRRLPVPSSDVTPLALGSVPRGPVLLGARLTAVEMPAPAAADPGLETAVRALLLAEPGHPLQGSTTTERLRSVSIDLGSGVISDGDRRPGLRTGAIGRWSLRQHGVDDDADHLSMVSVGDGRSESVVLDGLGLAGLAQVAGTERSAVVSVRDGDGFVRVHRLGSSRALPPLADTPATAVTGAGTHVVSTSLDPAGRVVLSRSDGGRWTAFRTVAGSEGTDRVLAVAGAEVFVASGATGARVVASGGG